jgi:uncharacterized membrane-anchored protein YhcB (DUF1043 family)
MSWQPVGVSLLSGTEEGRILITILNSLARELARLQNEIEELKRKTK